MVRLQNAPSWHPGMIPPGTGGPVRAASLARTRTVSGWNGSSCPQEIRAGTCRRAPRPGKTSLRAKSAGLSNAAALAARASG